MLPDKKKKVCRLCFFSLFFLFFFATSFISISFLKPHLASWSSTSPPGPLSRKKPTGGRARDNLTRTHIISYLPSLLLLEQLCSFFSVCEDQVGKVRLQPVPGNHLTEFWRAVVWEFKVRAQAALTERVQVLIHKRQGEVS